MSVEEVLNLFAEFFEFFFFVFMVEGLNIFQDFRNTDDFLQIYGGFLLFHVLDLLKEGEYFFLLFFRLLVLQRWNSNVCHWLLLELMDWFHHV